MIVPALIIELKALIVPRLENFLSDCKSFLCRGFGCDEFDFQVLSSSHQRIKNSLQKSQETTDWKSAEILDLLDELLKVGLPLIQGHSVY